MRAIKRAVIIAILLSLVIFFLYFFGISKMFTVEQLKLRRLALQNYVNSHYPQAVVWYISLYFLVAALAIPVATIFTLAGGFLFGTVPATLYTNIGATLGATAIFLLVRYSIGDTIQERYKQELTEFNAEFDANGFYYLLSVRFISVVPFFIINLCAGLTQATLAQFIITTAIGILPGSLVYSYAGQQLMHINSVRDIISLPVLLVFVAFALFSLLPVLIKKIARFYR